jgi:hypothetical protein
MTLQRAVPPGIPSAISRRHTPPSASLLAARQERMAELLAFECGARTVWLNLALPFMETKDGKSIARHIAGEAELTAGLLMTLILNASAWERRFGISRGTIADVAPAMRGKGLLHYPDSPKGAPLRATLCFPGDLTAEIWKVAAQIIGKKFELVEFSNFPVKI